jgi:CBS domain-containing protein
VTETLFGIELLPAAVPVGATFREAADVLTSHSVSTIAVLRDERVAGLFGAADLLEGIFPPYLKELRHTAWAPDDPDILVRRADEVAGVPVERYMHVPVTVDVRTSALHLAELFLHCDHDAIAVVHEERFAGMIGRAEFCRALLR